MRLEQSYFDNSFIVIYPVIHLGQEEYQIDFRRSGPDWHEVDLFVYTLSSYLHNYRIRRSKHFPALLTMPAFYADNVLEFMLEAIPQLLKVASVYYTDNFKRVMIKKSLRMNISSSQSTIEQYLECEFSLIDNWIGEVTKFAPALKCVGVTGSSETRNEIFAAWRDYDVFITSYGLV